MQYQFSRHYTRAEAEALLPEITHWLALLRENSKRLASAESKIAQLVRSGHDVGGDLVTDAFRFRAAVEDAIGEFTSREIELKDLERGLVDFPAFVLGREVFLCWKEGEERVEYWHDLDAGFAGREPIG